MSEASEFVWNSTSEGVDIFWALGDWWFAHILFLHTALLRLLDAKFDRHPTNLTTQRQTQCSFNYVLFIQPLCAKFDLRPANSTTQRLIRTKTRYSLTALRSNLLDTPVNFRPLYAQFQPTHQLIWPHSNCFIRLKTPKSASNVQPNLITFDAQILPDPPTLMWTTQTPNPLRKHFSLSSKTSNFVWSTT